MPVIWQDSIFVTDFVRLNRKGYIYRFNKEGDLIFKKPIRAFNNFEPWILKDKEQIILSFNNPKILEVFDFNGNTQKIKEVSDLGSTLFSENADGDIFAAIDRSIVALDHDLNTLWEYKPTQGFAYEAPAFDSVGNLYSLLNGHRLVSLDPKGRERWMTEVPGLWGRPHILNNDNILMVTSAPAGKPAEEEQFNTYVEIYSNLGRRTAYFDLPGDIFHVAHVYDKIFLATNCTRINVERE